MKLQRLALLGSTGSIGTQVLEVVRQHPNKFTIHTLTANRNWEALADQINEFSPEYGVICDSSCIDDLKKAVQTNTKILSAKDA